MEEQIWSQKRILVVDDEAAVLMVFQSSLQRMGRGYKIITAQGGHEALERVRDAPFDLIITDLRMPGMNGVELTRAIRVLNPKTPVIWMTAFGCQRVYAECDELSVFRCLDKPIEVFELREAALEALAASDDKRPP